ncbi:hypothetical protein H1C71_036197 [Ictidomys tridecemlineatus]|nr:hypothetical protein H1C71_036197 [Ictidomys tridecemlineatus]
MSYMLPHLHNGWQVDQAILSEEDRVVVIRFGHDWDPTCMKMDEVLYSIAEKVTAPPAPAAAAPRPAACAGSGRCWPFWPRAHGDPCSGGAPRRREPGSLPREGKKFCSYLSRGYYRST